MKKSIPDLMDCYDYSPLKTKAEQIVSAERIKELTMKRITDKTPYRAARPRRALVGALVAAVLLVALSGSAFATNLFGIREYFGEVFAAADTEMSLDDLATLETLGKTQMPAVTSNDTTMTPLAAVYDDKEFYLVLRVTAPAGTVLDRGEAYWQVFGDNWPEEMYSITYADTGEALGGSSSVMFNDDTPGDNELTIIWQFTRQDGRFGDGKSIILTIPGLWLQSADKVYTQILSGEWSFDIGKYGIPLEES